MNSTSLHLNIKSSFLDRDRLLTINNEHIEFDDKDHVSEKPTKFLKSEIEAFRYGIKWIRGYQFFIGRIYCIDVRSSNGEIIKIRLKSLYRINRKKLAAKYSAIVNALYDNIFYDISRACLLQFANVEQLTIQDVTFTTTGIYFNDKKVLINWQDVGTRSYATYYAIFSKSNPNVYKAFDYLIEWNTGILYCVSKQILKEKNLI